MDFFYEDHSAARAWKQRANENMKYANKMTTLANALTSVLIKIAPNHPLAKRENREKVVEGIISVDDDGNLK